MADEPAKAAGHGAKKRRPRCANHPKAPAVTKCEVCRKPICRECAELYEGPRICSETCWDAKAAQEREGASAKERALRKKKEKAADRAVTMGMRAAALAAIAAGAFFLYSRASDHSGDKLWELSGSAYSHNYSTLSHSSAICFVLSDGTVKVIDSLTGQPVWTAILPEGQRPSHPLMIDDETCLVHSENKVFLCRSGRGVPVWEVTAPRPVIYATPVIFNDNLYLASSSRASYYEMSPLMRILSAAAPESQRPSYSRKEQGEEETASTVIAADMASGAVRWRTDLKDMRVGGLLADGNRVYAAGYRPRRYSGFRYQRRDSSSSGGSDSTEDEEPLGATQLWALNAETGAREWKLEGTGDFLVPPMMSDEGIVFATKNNIYLVSVDGREKWKFPLLSRRVYSLTPYEDKLLVSTDDGYLACLDLESGERKWVAPTGAVTDKVEVSYPMVCVPGLVEVNREPRKVIPTKRWEGSEDLLAKALKSRGPSHEPILLGLDIESGEALWSIRKIEGEVEQADGIIYTLRHSTRSLLMDASADPSELAEVVSNLGAYDAVTGEKLWETGIEGYASGLRLAAGAAIMISRPEQFSIAAGSGGAATVRMIAISLQ